MLKDTKILQEEFGMFTEEGNYRVKRLIWQALTRGLDQLAEDVRKFEIIEYDNEEEINDAIAHGGLDDLHVYSRFMWLYFKLEYLAKQTRYEEASDKEVMGIAGGTLATMLIKNGIDCEGWKHVRI